MITKIKYIAFMLIVLSIFSCKKDKKSNIAQTKSKQFVEQDYFFPPELYYYQARTDYLIDKLFPLGWSDDGNFAFIVEPAMEGMDVYVFEMYIVNLISGDTLWHWATSPDEDVVREEVWKNNYNQFKTILNKYHIIQDKKPQLLAPYFTYQGDDFSVELQTDYRKEQGYGFEPVGHTKIIIRSPQRGIKIVYDKDLPRNSIIISQTIAGVLISPIDDKIAIILQQERPGYEGPPNVITFQIVGTSLGAGWNYEN